MACMFTVRVSKYGDWQLANLTHFWVECGHTIKSRRRQAVNKMRKTTKVARRFAFLRMTMSSRLAALSTFRTFS